MPTQASGDVGGRPPDGGSPWLCWKPGGSSSDGKAKDRAGQAGGGGVQFLLSVATGEPVTGAEQRRGGASAGPLHCGLSRLGSLCL